MELQGAIPPIPVQHISRGLSFYRDQLALRVEQQDPGVAVVRRGTLELHLRETNDETWRTRRGGNPVYSGAESFLAGTVTCRIVVTEIDRLLWQYSSHDAAHPPPVG